MTPDRSIEVRRASPVGDVRVPRVTINIHGELPGLPPLLPGQTVAESLAPVDAIYQQDATAIANALSASLPGGTFDRLIVELLKMKASHFRVPWGDR